MNVYNKFKKWQSGYCVAIISSNLIMTYFHTLEGNKYKPTSLWAFHSMLKATLRVNDNVDISAFHQVTAFLKGKSAGYKCVMAKVFNEEEIKHFIDHAEDLAWLDVKVSDAKFY